MLVVVCPYARQAAIWEVYPGVIELECRDCQNTTCVYKLSPVATRDTSDFDRPVHGTCTGLLRCDRLGLVREVSE